MSYKWDKNDREIWEKNEVLQELEKRLIAAAFELQKKVEAQMDSDTSKKIEEVSESASKAKEQVTELVESTQSLAEDGEDDDEEVEVEITSEEKAAAREALLSELKQMVAEAISKRYVKLAYKIERTIEEITLED